MVFGKLLKLIKKVYLKIIKIKACLDLLVSKFNMLKKHNDVHQGSWVLPGQDLQELS